MSALIALCCCFVFQSAKADVEHHLFRKIAVFPVGDANFASSEDAWWQMRETLTREQRFLVASRRFMINRGVFQPRRTLKAADAIILGKILDAEALMTIYLDSRTLRMNVYQAEDGSKLWESSLELHPALPVADQLIRASQKMVQDFLLALPYQAFQIVDEVVGKPVFEVGDKKRAWIFHGGSSGLEHGEAIQWVEVRADAGGAFFNSNVRTQVIAEGRVISIKGSHAEVEIEKVRDPKDLKENALIRLPREIEKLKAQYMGDEKGSALSAEYLSSEMKSPSEFNKGHHPTSTALAWLGNLAMLLLLAF